TKTTKPDTSLATKTGHFHLLPTRYKCSSRPLSFASSAVRALIPIRDRPRRALPAPNDLATANVHTEPSFSVAYMACGSPYGVEIAIPPTFRRASQIFVLHDYS